MASPVSPHNRSSFQDTGNTRAEEKALKEASNIVKLVQVNLLKKRSVYRLIDVCKSLKKGSSGGSFIARISIGDSTTKHINQRKVARELKVLLGGHRCGLRTSFTTDCHWVALVHL